MALSSAPAKLTTEDIFAAITQLQPTEADKLTLRLLHLQAERKAPHIPEREAELLDRIYRVKRPEFRERFDTLFAKLRAFTLTPEEHEEFMRLTDESEAFDVQRLEALVELAKLRGKTLPTLMQDLGLKAPNGV